MKFRSTPVRAKPLKVDRERRVIEDVSMFQSFVEALGHGVQGDDLTLAQIAYKGNGRSVGIKSRLGHPGLSEDGTARQLGRIKNFRVSPQGKVVGDIHLLESSKFSPEFSQDPGEWLMSMAEEAPEDFGMSVVIDADPYWITDEGEEIFAGDDPTKYKSTKPQNSKYEYPVLRVEQLMAVDVVDDPAANRSGLFHQLNREGYSANTAAVMFEKIDEFLAEGGFTPEKAYQFATRYFAARGVLTNATVVGGDMETHMNKKDEADVATPEGESPQATQASAVTFSPEVVSQLVEVLALDTVFESINNRLVELGNMVGEQAKLLSTLSAQAIQLADANAQLKLEAERAHGFTVQTEPVKPTVKYLELFSQRNNVFSNSNANPVPAAVPVVTQQPPATPPAQPATVTNPYTNLNRTVQGSMQKKGDLLANKFGG